MNLKSFFFYAIRSVETIKVLCEVQDCCIISVVFTTWYNFLNQKFLSTFNPLSWIKGTQNCFTLLLVFMYRLFCTIRNFLSPILVVRCVNFITNKHNTVHTVYNSFPSIHIFVVKCKLPFLYKQP